MNYGKKIKSGYKEQDLAVAQDKKTPGREKSDAGRQSAQARPKGQAPITLIALDRRLGV